MATTLTLPSHPRVQQKRQARSGTAFGIAFATALTPFTLAVHGYHPYAEDGGVYLAGVKKLLNPALFPRWSEFVTEHLRFSLFAPLVAGLVRISHLPLMTVWLLLYIATFWLTLFAGWLLATRCYLSTEARCGTVVLLAAWLTMPVAGTALMLMDPYLSARSLSTPFTMLALAGVLDLVRPSSNQGSRPKTIALCFGSLVAAALVHPLMAAYGLGFAILLACNLSNDHRIRTGGTLAVALSTVLAASAFFATASTETTDYQTVALTRTYWFIAQWRWYELFGLAAPLAILVAASLQRQNPATLAARRLARAGAIAGGLAIALAAIFARSAASTYLIARLQPLRVFQIVYLIMIFAVGAYLGEWVLQRRAWRWVVTITILATVMLYAERNTFAHSSHFESPWREQSNDWERAFEWIRTNTPLDALFALDANYVSQPGEDAQTFRAAAERSVLPDYSKDGGEASITPALTAAWSNGQAAQTGLNTATDAIRIAALRPLGVTWLVLPSSAATEFTCDYAVGTVKVCQLPE